MFVQVLVHTCLKIRSLSVPWAGGRSLARGCGGEVGSERVAARGFDQSPRLAVAPLACLYLKKFGWETG